MFGPRIISILDAFSISSGFIIIPSSSAEDCIMSEESLASFPSSRLSRVSF